MKYIYSFLIIFVLASFGFSQDTQVPKKDIPKADVVSNKVDGLELPANMEVSPKEGFVIVQAVCKGSVKWLVISENEEKYVINSSNNSVIVAVPQTGTITIMAIGLVDNKMTDFAKTTVRSSKVEDKKKTSPEEKPANYSIRW